MPEDDNKVVEATPGVIPSRMEKLEEGIRELHDRLTPMMIEPFAKEDDKAQQPCSDMSASLQLMNELVYDILKRLEL